MLETFSVSTSSRTEMIDITSRVRTVVQGSGVRGGLVVVFVPHTTAGVTINENADPDVTRDMTGFSSKLVPRDRSFRHGEGNSDAHIKSTLYGPSLTVIVDEGDLVLGTWQGIYFSEFDGPRTRRVHVKVVPDAGAGE